MTACERAPWSARTPANPKSWSREDAPLDGARARRSYRKSGRVLARKEGDDPKREYPATIVKVHDCGTVYDIKYDDGTTWKNAPAEVVRLR